MVKIILGTKSGSFFNKGWRVEKLDRGKQRGEYFTLKNYHIPVLE
jgi:hypothetical protein